MKAFRAKGEPTLPLINIVFLMLIFFLVSAQTARPIDPSMELVETDDEALVPPPDAVVIAADGTLTFRGAPATVSEIVAALSETAEARLLPDRRAPAQAVIGVAAELREAGAKAVFIVTEQAL